MRVAALVVCGLGGLGALDAACQPRWGGAMAELSNPDPAKRIEAVKRIARLGNPDEMASLVYRANDPSAQVRVTIAQALGSLDNRPAADALATLVADPDESVELSAVASLARQRNLQAHAYLLLAYQRDGPAVRARVVELLKADGVSAAEAVNAEAAALYTQYSKELASTGAVRLMAAERLGSSGRPEAIERLTNYLAAESRSLALSAARGLGASGSPEARGPLEALLTEDDPALRLAGAEALGDLGDPRAADALLRVLQPGDLVAQAAVRSLIHLAQLEGQSRPKPPEHARLLLCDAALASDPALTLQAANAILFLQIACPVDKLRTRLARGGDVAGTLAAAAVMWAYAPKAAAKLDDTGRARLAPVIGSLLRSGSPRLRPLAARAAGALQLMALAPDLERARKEGELDVQRARQHWINLPLRDEGNPLADAGAAATAARIPSLFNADPQAALGVWAEASAAELRLSLPSATAAADLLQTLVRDPAPAVRIAVARATPALPSGEQWAALQPLLDDPEPGVRAAARNQLAKLDPAAAAQAGPWMISELAQATSETSVTPLVDALSLIPSLPGVDAALVSALERPETAQAAAQALARIGDAVAIAAILDHLRRPYALALPELLEAAASQAASLTPDQASAAADACRALLFHPRPEVRAAAVRALFALAGPGAFADVQPLVGDYDLRVRRAVAER